jgi:glycosyltransferase involved in cell wall biosynthesis
MAQLRVLYISNSHPDLYIGGAEVYSYELYRGMREREGFEPIFLARTISGGHRPHRGTPFLSINDDPNQLLWYQENHDYFLITCPQKEQYTVHFHELLTTYRPDVVHVQHTVGLGYDLLRQIVTSLPGTPIVYTLHEFLPICHAKGLLLRTGGKELCLEATPARCHECFPEIPPQRFFLRERFIRSHLAHVDLFLAPSHFLLERFRDWGIPAEKIRFQEYGRLAPPHREAADRDATAGDASGDDGPPVGNFGFFGQLRPHKGVLVLLRAMRLLWESGERELHLFLNGANLESEGEEFQRQVETLLEACPNVTFLGRYAPEEISRRMRDVAWVVVPSLWWENSPLVIQEAFMHRRPVICSDVGGMAEKVSDGVDGLHFRVGDPADLAEKMRTAASRELWRRLRARIAPVYSMTEAVEAHAAIYRSLVAERGRQPAGELASADRRRG